MVETHSPLFSMHTSNEFKCLALAEMNARKSIRLLELAHFADGHSRTQIAKYLKVSYRSECLGDKLP